jgi:hypothetical protein
VWIDRREDRRAALARRSEDSALVWSLDRATARSFEQTIAHPRRSGQASGDQMSKTRSTEPTAGQPRHAPPSAERLLAEAAALIAGGWSQKALARDRNGREVEPWSESACRWSPLGALTKVWHERRGVELEVFEAAYAALALATGGRPEEWNAARWRTKRHVLRAFAHAREYLPEALRQFNAG